MWHPFRAVVRLSINIDILKAPMCLGGAGLPVDKLKLQGNILALFPKHCECRRIVLPMFASCDPCPSLLYSTECCCWSGVQGKPDKYIEQIEAQQQRMPLFSPLREKEMRVCQEVGYCTRPVFFFRGDFLTVVARKTSCQNVTGEYRERKSRPLVVVDRIDGIEPESQGRWHNSAEFSPQERHTFQRCRTQCSSVTSLY